MESSRAEKALKNISGDISVKIISILLSFALRTVFIKTLGSQYMGVSTLFSDILSVLSFAELGISSALLYALYRPMAERDEKKLAQLMDFYKKAYRLVALVIFAAGLCLVPFLPDLVTEVPDIREDLTAIYLLFLVQSAATYLMVYRSALLNANQESYLIARFNIAFNFIKNIGQCMLLLAFQAFFPYLLWGIGSELVRNLTISLYAKRRFRGLEQYRGQTLPREEQKRLFANVRAIMVQKIANISVGSADSIIISAFLATPLVAVLGNYKLVVSTVNVYVAVFGDSVGPSVGNLAASANGEAQFEVFRKFRFVTSWMACFCTVSLAVLLSPFIRLWLGEEHLMGESVVLMLVLDFYLITVFRPIASFREANGLFRQVRLRVILTVVVNIAVSLALAGPLGLFGVMAGTAVSRLVTEAWYDPCLIYRQVFHKPVSEYFLAMAKPSVLTVACIAGGWALKQALAEVPPLMAFVLLCLYCAAVPNGIMLLCYRRSEEFRYAIRLLMRLIPGKKN